MGSDADDISGKADKQEFQHACRGRGRALRFSLNC